MINWKMWKPVIVQRISKLQQEKKKETFGSEKRKIHGYPGHQEIELVLVKLYRVTNEKKYLDLAKYFIDLRGTGKNYFLEEEKRPEHKRIFPDFVNYDTMYAQSHEPVRKQKKAEGHAVRANYMYSAMADMEKDASYMDVVERALYNTLLSGIAMDGKSFFYVNPLEVWPANCMPRTSREHVKHVRQKWFGVACCPPNITRTLASLGQYIYFQEENEIYVNLYIANETEVTLNGVPFKRCDDRLQSSCICPKFQNFEKWKRGETDSRPWIYQSFRKNV